MGACTFCGQPAGWFKSAHGECQTKHNDGVSMVRKLAARAAAPGSDVAALAREIDQVCATHWIGPALREDLTVQEWNLALDRYCDDGIVTAQEERALEAYRDGLGLTPDILRPSGGHTRFVKALLLRDLAEGIVDQRFDPGSFDRVNLQRGERVAWIFSGVDYIEEKRRRQYVGGSTGVSVRVMKGVYLRQSAFRGEPVDTVENVVVDHGYAVFTDRHIYFSGDSKAWRIPYGKILSMTAYSDGIGLIKEAASPKPQVLITGDGLFTYNMARALSDLAAD